MKLKFVGIATETFKILNFPSNEVKTANHVMVKNKLIYAIFLMVFIFSNNAYSHSGGTNSDGCHNENRTGGYHCHNSGSTDSGGEGEILAGVLIAGLVCWYIVSNKPEKSSIYKQNVKNVSRFKLSLIPKLNENEAVLISLNYEF